MVELGLGDGLLDARTLVAIARGTWGPSRSCSSGG
jgi:hypothetical protein